MNDQQSQVPKSNVNSVIIVAVLLLVVVAGVASYQMLNKKEPEKIIAETTVTPNESTPETTPAVTGADSAKLATYKNGTYAVIGQYKSPAGPEEIGVTIVLENAVIKDVTVEAKATNPISVKRQEAFINEYKTQVVGKNIDEVQLDKVGGSSLTSSGFNDALEKVKQESMS